MQYLKSYFGFSRIFFHWLDKEEFFFLGEFKRHQILGFSEPTGCRNWSYISFEKKFEINPKGFAFGISFSWEHRAHELIYFGDDSSTLQRSNRWITLFMVFQNLNTENHQGSLIFFITVNMKSQITKCSEKSRSPNINRT